VFNLDVFSIIGTVAFAFSGYIMGVRHQLDLLGIGICTFLTGCGGGVMRDVLVGRVPRIFVEYPVVSLILGTYIVSYFLRIHRHENQLLMRLFLIADSIGLVAFSIAGAQLAIAYQFNVFGVMILAFVSAIGGGIARDILINEVPVILYRDVYGIISIGIALAMQVLQVGSHLNGWTTHLVFFLALGIRLWAVARSLQLPKITHSDPIKNQA
jgi:uncharacterized membrane protein YeiH